MPFVKDINIGIDAGGTTAVATFTQLFEGTWEMGMLDFLRVAGTRKWTAVHNPDVLHEVKTILTREMNTKYAAINGPRKRFATLPTGHLSKVERKPAPAPMPEPTLLDLPLSRYKRVTRAASRTPTVTLTPPVTPALTRCESARCKRRAFEGAHRKTGQCADVVPVTAAEPVVPVVPVVTVTAEPRCESSRCRRLAYKGPHELTSLCADA